MKKTKYESKQFNMRWPVDLIAKALKKAQDEYLNLSQYVFRLVAANIGINGIIKGVIGTWITLAEYDDKNICKCVKSAKIDGEKIKADTWYKLVNGKFTEAK